MTAKWTSDDVPGQQGRRAEKEPNMNDVLDFVLGAHGGLKRWLSAQHLLSG